MFYAAAVRDYGFLYRGDQLEVQAVLFTGENGFNNYYFPANATMKAALPGLTEGTSVVTTDVTKVSDAGVLKIRMSKEQTVLLKAGQPTIVVTVTADDYAQTFEIRAPFWIKARTLAVP